MAVPEWPQLPEVYSCSLQQKIPDTNGLNITKEKNVMLLSSFYRKKSKLSKDK